MASATWEEYLQSQENVDGVRFTWNMWPHSKIDASRLVVPVGVFFSPMKERPPDVATPPPLTYEPVVCTKNTCHSILNPFWSAQEQNENY